MIKKYKVTIDDEVYQVSVEAIRENEEGGHQPLTPSPKAAPAPAPKAPAAMPKAAAAPARKPAPASAPKAKPAPAGAAGGTMIKAPLPGNMWKVKTSAGQKVKKGDVLFIIEAMKMENEIFAPCDGTVDSVSVSEGAAVSTGDLLCVIK